MLKIAINGYGRIGRLAHRLIIEKYSRQISVVAINGTNSTDIQGWMYLLKYDTVYGKLKLKIKNEKLKTQIKNKKDRIIESVGSLVIDGSTVPFFAEKEPRDLPWKELGVEVVIESTGKFRTADLARGHLEAGAKKVILTAPAKGDGQIKTVILGVNFPNIQYQISNIQLFSCASCTTNCITPVAAVIEEKFGIAKAMMTTVHGYTSDQRLQDGGHKDYRRARAAALNIVPTTTGAAEAAAKALPQLKGIFTGLALRVPVINGSLADMTFVLQRPVTAAEVNQAMIEAAAEPRYQNILAVTNEPLVSSDIIGNSHSAIVDLGLTQVVGGNLVKVIAWYDNEWGYVNRLVEEVLLVEKVKEK